MPERDEFDFYLDVPKGECDLNNDPLKYIAGFVAFKFKGKYPELGDPKR